MKKQLSITFKLELVIQKQDSTRRATNRIRHWQARSFTKWYEDHEFCKREKRCNNLKKEQKKEE